MKPSAAGDEHLRHSGSHAQRRARRRAPAPRTGPAAIQSERVQSGCPATRPIAVSTPIATSSHSAGRSSDSTGGPRTRRRTREPRAASAARRANEHAADDAEVGEHLDVGVLDARRGAPATGTPISGVGRGSCSVQRAAGAARRRTRRSSACQPAPSDGVVDEDAPAVVDEHRPLDVGLDAGLLLLVADPDEVEERLHVAAAEDDHAAEDRRRRCRRSRPRGGSERRARPPRRPPRPRASPIAPAERSRDEEAERACDAGRRREPPVDAPRRAARSRRARSRARRPRARAKS